MKQRYDCPHQDAFEWSASPELWAYVMEGRDGFVCLDCFRNLAQEKNAPIWVTVNPWSGCECAFTEQQQAVLAELRRMAGGGK